VRRESEGGYTAVEINVEGERSGAAERVKKGFELWASQPPAPPRYVTWVRTVLWPTLQVAAHSTPYTVITQYTVRSTPYSVLINSSE